MNIQFINIAYIIASVAFIFGLKLLSSPVTARKGNALSALGMLIAIVAALLSKEILNAKWIILGVTIGSVIGLLSARLVAMTKMPEMVALFNAFGGIASLFVGWAEYEKLIGLSQIAEGSHTITLAAIFFAVFIGGITFTGSLIAFGKLSEYLPGKALVYPGQVFVNMLLLVLIFSLGVFWVIDPVGEPMNVLMDLPRQFAAFSSHDIFIGVVGLSLLIGVLMAIPIGGADMPVVISLLNSYSGLAACAAGFVIMNNVLIVSGALVGASGIILTNIMCKAMNRSLANVLFSGFGSVKTSTKKVEGEAKPISAEDAYLILEASKSVVIVPGYGMAVAQAQHVVRELAEMLEKNGAEVSFAIHPVAGRMPGHMNVLLAEANVSYDQLREMDEINPIIETIDVAIVIGANDVVNPAAREDETSPIYGMPVINVDKARTVFVLKRSMNPGFAGIDNPLFFKDNVRMLFGDAKGTVQSLVGEFKGS